MRLRRRRQVEARERELQAAMNKKKAEEIESGLNQINWDIYGKVIYLYYCFIISRCCIIYR